MGEQYNIEGAELGNRSTDEEGREDSEKKGISYQEIIEGLTRNKKVMILIIALCFCVIMGWLIGYNYGFQLAQSLAQDCLLYA